MKARLARVCRSGAVSSAMTISEWWYVEWRNKLYDCDIAMSNLTNTHCNDKILRYNAMRRPTGLHQSSALLYKMDAWILNLVVLRHSRNHCIED